MVKKVRTNYAQGLIWVLCKVCKNCPRLLQRLQRILNVIWRRGEVAHQWMQKLCEFQKKMSQRTLISLEPTHSSMVREIYLPDRLPPDELLHWYSPERRDSEDTMDSEACRRCHHVVIPNKLVEEALNQHHIPGKFRDLILNYYNSFSLSPQVEQQPEAPQKPPEWRINGDPYYGGATIPRILQPKLSGWYQVQDRSGGQQRQWMLLCHD